MKRTPRIPGISSAVYSNVLATQYSKESTILTADESLRQSDFFEPLLFFMGVSYSPSRFPDEIVKIEKYLRDRLRQMADFELGIYFHLKGFLYSKQEVDKYHIVFDALTRSIEHLNSAGSKPSKYYIARVSDTYGQVLQTVGFNKDALLMYKESLKIKKEFKDEASVALTHGNIGRLYFDIGNVKQAVKHLKLDLNIISRSGELKNLQSKLMNQIAMGLIEIGEFTQAVRYIKKSVEYSKTANLEGAFFANYTLAYYHLLTRDLIESKKIISKLRQLLAKASKNNNRDTFQSRVDYLSGLLALVSGKPAQANVLFRNAEYHYMADLSNSITEKARFCFFQSEASDKSGNNEQSSFQLRKALSLLDQTENIKLRNEYEIALKKRHKEGWLIHSTGRFLGQHQIEMILNDTSFDGLQSKSSDTAIMFSDIRDFTKLSEGMSANGLIEWLNSYLNTMSKYIHLQGGIIDKYIGDAIMAWFSPSASDKLSIAERACVTAITMNHELGRFNRQNKSKIRIGIGINFGNCAFGMIGTRQKRSLSVIGDVVNVASRMESLTKILGAGIIISEALYKRLPKNHGFIIRPLGRFTLMGKQVPIKLAELMGVDNNSKEVNAQKKEIQLMKKVLAQFSSGDFSNACEGFMGLFRLCSGHDRALGYKFMADYTRNIIKAGIPKDWDGIFHIFAK